MSSDHSPSTSFHTPLISSSPCDLMDDDQIPLQPLSQENDEALPTSLLQPFPPPRSHADYPRGNPYQGQKIKLESVDDYIEAANQEARLEGSDEGSDEQDTGSATAPNENQTNASPAKRRRNKRRQNAEMSDAADVPPQPVILTTSITTTHAKDLYELCQSHVRLTPRFDYEQKKPQEFAVVLKLVGSQGRTEEFPVEGTFPSKRHAKEAAAAVGLAYVRKLPRDGSSGLFALEDTKETENWVGLLSDMCNGKQIRPQYTDFATPGAGFSCEVSLGPELGYPGIEDQVFGNRYRAFKNKRSAKVAAAKEAILWIREQVPPTTPHNGRVVKAAADISGGIVDVPEGTSPAKVVNLICPRLGYNSPEYIFHADPIAPGFYNVDAVIKRPKGSRPVKIGPIKNVFGKKKAREEISVCVLRWLRKEAEKNGVTINESLLDTPNE